MKLVNNLDFNKFEARNLKLQNLATAPASPTLGQSYYDTALSKPRIWDGTAWQDMVAGAPASHTHSAADISAGTLDIARIPVAASGTSSATQVVRADDSRLSNARTPTAHVHSGTDITTGTIDVLRLPTGVTAATVALGNHSHYLAGLTDVSITSAAAGDILRHNGTAWVDATLAISDTSGLQAALDAKLDDSQLGAASGVASLGADGKIPQAQLPNISLTDVSVVATITARDALTVQEGDVAIVTGTSETFIYDGTAWQKIQSPVDGVQSVTAGTGITIGGTGTAPTVAITAGGVGATELNTAVAGNGLTGGGGTALAVNAGTGLEISSDTVRIAAAAAGNGLTGGAGSALAVGAGTGISVSADAVAVDTAVVVRKAAFNVGDGTATSFVLAHNLNTRDVTVAVYTNATPYDEVLADVEHTDLNNITIRFAAAPAASAYRAVVHG